MSTFHPTKAVVLAAGFGTRMRPLSLDLPKPLMPLWGKPLIERALLLLRSWGVQKVLINLHHAPGEILEWARHHPVPGLEIDCSFEPEILGTGGALRRGEWFLHGPHPFWMLNADVAAELDPTPLLRAFRRGRTLAALWMEPRLGPRTVEMNTGVITSFSTRQPGKKGTFTFTGLHLCSPRVLDMLPPDGFSSIIHAYEKAMSKGHIIRGVCVPNSFWADLGTPGQYLDAHRDIRSLALQGKPGKSLFNSSAEKRIRTLTTQGVRIEGFASIGNQVHVEPGASLRDVILWDGVQVGKKAQMDHFIAGRNVCLNHPVRYVAVRAESMFQPPILQALENMGMKAASSVAEPFKARGSDRSFTRVRTNRRGVIVVQYGSERAENRLYTTHARFLATLGIPVPRVLIDQPRERFCILEDLGDSTLESVLHGASSLRRMNLYRAILEKVARLHLRGAREARRRHRMLMPPFTGSLYRWEHDYFITHFVEARQTMPILKRRLRQELESVQRKLSGTPQVLIHRDLQSSNILFHRGRPCFIDFQGMRFGSAAYDLASLLCDPYVMLPAGEQEALLRHYMMLTGSLQLADTFWPAAVQRLAQALGAYGRLSARPEMSSFKRYIPPALTMMLRALAHLQNLPALEEFCRQELAKPD
ncbi:MAG: sugar phosphate nucleotidyltransferase [Lentisphaerota bacterium]